jgi:Domain of unknown function (DUF4157)/Protein-glutamine gamma-glutamyltransferase
MYASAALARVQKPGSSDWVRPRLQLSSRQRTRDDPFEREAESNARVARNGGALPMRTLRDVRIHADDDSARAAQGIGAHAFTVGSDVFFGRSEYQPSTAHGRGLIAHELTHVEQQRSGRSSGVQGSWWEGAGAIVGGVAGAIVGGIFGGAAGAILLGAAGALLGGLAGHGLRWAIEGDPDVDRTEPEDKGLAENDPKFQETFQEKLQEGMKVLERSSCAFPYADREWKYDKRYWKRVKDDDYVAYKPKGVSAAKAFDELLNNINLWEFDCALYPEIVWLYAYRKTLGAANFNSRFPDLVVRQHSTKGIKKTSYDVDSMGKAEFDRIWDDAPAGTKVTWTNRSTVTHGTAWNHENAIKRTKGATPDEARYDAHPLGHNMTEPAVKKGLAQNASDWPKTDTAAQTTYIDTNIYRHQLQLLKV